MGENVKKGGAVAGGNLAMMSTGTELISQFATTMQKHEDSLNANVDKVDQALNTVVKDLAKHGYLHPSRTHILETPESKRRISRLVEKITTGQIDLENYNLNKAKSRANRSSLNIPLNHDAAFNSSFNPTVSVEPPPVSVQLQNPTLAEDHLTVIKSAKPRPSKKSKSRKRQKNSKAAVAIELAEAEIISIPGFEDSDIDSKAKAENSRKRTVVTSKKKRPKNNKRGGVLNTSSFAIGLNELEDVHQAQQQLTSSTGSHGHNRSRSSRRKKKTIQIPKSKLFKDVSAALSKEGGHYENNNELPSTAPPPLKHGKSYSRKKKHNNQDIPSTAIEPADYINNKINEKGQNLLKKVSLTSKRNENRLDEAEKKVAVGNLHQLNDFTILESINPHKKRLTIGKLQEDQKQSGGTTKGRRIVTAINSPSTSASTVNNGTGTGTGPRENKPKNKKSSSAVKMSNIVRGFHTEANFAGFHDDNVSFSLEGHSLIIVGYRPRDRFHHARKVTEIVEIPDSVNIDYLKLGRKPNGIIWIEEWVLNEENSVQAQLNPYLTAAYTNDHESIAIATVQGKPPI